MKRPAPGHGWTALAVALAVCCCAAGGCRTGPPLPVLADPATNYLSAAVSAALAEPATPLPPLDCDRAIAQAMEHNPDIVRRRGEERLAAAAARTVQGLRDPELRLGYGEGREYAERSWLVANPATLSALPVDPVNAQETILTSDPALYNISTNLGTRRILVPPGQEGQYLSVSSNHFEGTTADTEYFSVGLRFYPPNPFLIAAQRSGAKAAWKAAIAARRAAEWQVEADVRTCFEDMAWLQQDLASVQELLEVRRRLYAATTNRLAHGEGTRLDLMRVAQDILQSVTQREQIEGNLQRERTRLSLLIGAPVLEVTTQGLVEPAAVDADALDLTRLVWEAQARRQDSLSTYWQYLAAAAALREARSTRWPWFSFVEGSYQRNVRQDRESSVWPMSGGYEQYDEFLAIPFDEEEQEEWRIDAAITIPFFSLGPGTTRVPAADLRRSRLAMLETSRQVRAEVEAALLGLRRAGEERRQLEADAEPHAGDARALLEDLRLNPDSTPADEARLREMALQWERMRQESRHNWRRALLDLDRAVGYPIAPIPTPVP